MLENILKSSNTKNILESDDSSLLQQADMIYENEDEYILEEQLQTQKMKIIFNLEMVQFLIGKLAEFDEIANSLLHLYNVIQSRITKINNINRKKNHYSFLNDKDEIQVCISIYIIFFWFSVCVYKFLNCWQVAFFIASSSCVNFFQCGVFVYMSVF